jgi:exodeoxyribonuclease VII large subunit
VTSPSGAVWRDICNVLARRWPLTSVVLVAARVQGEDAPASIVAGLRRVERWAAQRLAEGDEARAPALTILARGGGSLEDLWAFNDERVVRAVVAHTLPVVSGIGHEVDATLTDFAADVRAPTPSAAAELVVPDRTDVLAAVTSVRRGLDATMARRLAATGRDLLAERRVLDRLHPAAQLATARERSGLLLDRGTRAITARLTGDRRAVERLAAALAPILPRRLATDRATLRRAEVLGGIAARRVARARSGLDAAGAALAVLGPQATLERGYAIVRRTADGSIVRAPADAPAGTSLAVRVARGELPATADER